MQRLASPPSKNPGTRSGQPLVDRLVCWDLDETMGRFYGIYAELHGRAYEGRDGIKPGLREALGELSLLGFTHAVTTAAPARLANAALARSELLRHFSRVFAEEDIFTDQSLLRKDYSAVCGHFGISGEEFRRRVLVVGDIFPLDKPDGGVFIYEPDSPFYSAHATKELIRLISEKGSGDFWSGFGNLFNECRRSALHVRASDFTEGFSASLYYSDGAAVAQIGITEGRFRLEPEPF